WALWGQARGRSDDDLIHVGRAEMEVAFEFRLDHLQYRVIRKRQRRSKGAQTALEFAVLDGESYRPLTGATIAETQRRINETLRLTYQTFVNSAFILQGRADEFTTSKPSERKAVLAEILDLAYYDRLEERARQLAREKEAEARELAVAIKELQGHIDQRSHYEQRERDLSTKLEQVEQRLRLQEAHVATLREKRRRLDDARSEVQRLARQIEQWRAAKDQSAQHADVQERHLARCRALLDRSAEIEEGYQRLQAARKAVESWVARLQEVSALRQREAELRQRLAQEQTRLATTVEHLTREVADLKQRAQQAPSLEQALAAARADLADLERCQAERREAEETLAHARAEYEQRLSANQRLEEEAIQHKARLATIVDATQCPLCRSALTPEARQRVREQYEAEVEVFRRQYRENRDEMTRAKQAMEEAQTRLQALESRLRRLADAQRQVAAMEGRLADAEEARQRLEERQANLAALQQQLAAKAFLPEVRQELDAVTREIARVGYDEAAHASAKSAAESLARYESEWLSLAHAREELPRVQLALETARNQVAEYARLLSETEERLRELTTQVSEFERLQEEMTAAEHELQHLRHVYQETSLELGAVRQQIEHVAFAERQRDEKRSRLERAQREREIYRELAAAFGKKGIQAWIIESVLPELEDEANRLLARMTDGRMHVKLQTQRDTKSGGTVETLDVLISDEWGTRDYSMFSGGEAFRIDFAIRVALSKLLARRAGARLETLVIDEGFGSLDAVGRERLVEAITAVQDDFATVLVITHLQELKDLFPVRIDIVKTPRGSLIQPN
ncbi:MAG TPA: SMC family ATPase, partial [Chloroflexota bacterium]